MTQYGEEVTLFVVEDDNVDFMAIQRSFKRKRIANPVVRAFNGVEALNMLANAEVSFPCIVLLDLQMPQMGGLEFLSKIRSTPTLSDIVVFILTSSDEEKDILESYQHHVAGYFVKDEVGESFMEVVTLLEGYWRITHIPKG